MNERKDSRKKAWRLMMFTALETCMQKSYTFSATMLCFSSKEVNIKIQDIRTIVKYIFRSVY